MSYQVNINDIERAVELLGGEAKAKRIQDYILKHHCDGRVPDRYQHEKSFRQTIQRKIEDYCPEAEGFEFKGNEARFHRVGHGLYRIITENKRQLETIVSENANNSKHHTEGAKIEIITTAYERDAAARAVCIAHYGVTCSVCRINFEKTYGGLGKGFIHVHHLRPLSTIREEYKLDPLKDLRPVCPNCHAMLHKTNPPLTIQDLIGRLQ